MLHIIHNSTLDFGRSMERFDGVIAELTQVSKMLRPRDRRESLLESCFSDATGRLVQGVLRHFTAKFHKGRWGTLADVVRATFAV